MKIAPFSTVLVALLCVAVYAVAEPARENVFDEDASVTRANPRFYVRGSERSNGPVAQESALDEEADQLEAEDASNEAVQTYYPIADDNGQTYLIPENVLQVMSDRREANDDTDTYLVPNGSVRLEADEDSDDDEGDEAIILSEEPEDENDLEASNQYATYVREGDDYGKSRRIQVRRGGGLRSRRRSGGRRRVQRRGGSRQGLIRRVSRKRIRRGGGARGNRRRGGGGGGRVRLGRVRLRPRRGMRFGF